LASGSTISLAYLFDQPAKPFCDADETGLAPAQRRNPAKLFDQPGSERVELPHAGNVNDGLLRVANVEIERVDEPLKLGNVLGGPGTCRSELDLIVVAASGQ
jgi:hypothetical protein